MSSSLITLAFGAIGFLLALARPNTAIALVLLVLYFPLLPNVPIGPLEFSASTLIIVGLFLKSLGSKHENANRLANWQRFLLVALAIAFFLSTIFGNMPANSLRAIPNLVIYWMLIFALMKLVRSYDQLWSIARLITVAGFILSIWRVELRPLRLLLGLPSLGINGAVFAFHPAVALATITVVMLPAAATSRRWRIFNWLALFSLVYHGILYQTRAGWLAWMGMLAIIGIQSRSRARVAFIVGIAVLAGLVLIVFADTIDANLAQTRTTVQAALGDETYSSVNSDDLVRLIARDAGWSMFKERPVLGWGPDAYTRLKPAFVTYIVKEANDPGAFNSWLTMLVDFGFIGTGVVLVIFLLPLLQTWLSLRHDRSPNTLLAFSFAIGVLGLSVHLLFIDLLYSFTWAHVGLTLAASRLALEDTQSSLEKHTFALLDINNRQKSNLKVAQ